MQTSTATALLVLATTYLAALPANASGPGALDELKEGYALKQQGKCDEAMLHFRASYRLDPTPKALLNMSDCEQRLGDLVAARVHAGEGQEAAQRLGDTELVDTANEQLAAIDKRLARLTIRIAPSASPRLTVSCDGQVVDATAFDRPSPMNPGKHELIFTAPGFVTRNLEITLGQGERREVDAEPGAKQDAEVPPPRPTASVLPPKQATPEHRLDTRDVVAFGLAGAGVIGIVVGSIFGLEAISKNKDSYVDCAAYNPNICNLNGVTIRNDALSKADVSTVMFGVGLASVAGGVVVYLTASRGAASPASALAVSPALITGGGGVNVRALW